MPSLRTPMFLSAVLLMATFTLTACSQEEQTTDDIYTLYHNGPNTPRARFRWATFESFKDAEKNSEDCEMTARIMNANMATYAKQRNVAQYADIGFWCEAGSFTMDGENPAEFKAEYPSNRNVGRRVGQ